MSAGYARQAKRVMSAECLSSVCLNLLDSYPRIKALHFHQNYVAPPHGNGTNIESFFHIRWGIVLLCSCSQSYAVLANCIFVTGQALSCPSISQVTPSGADRPNFRKPCGDGHCQVRYENPRPNVMIKFLILWTISFSTTRSSMSSSLSPNCSTLM